MRSLVEHRTTATHRAATTTIRSTGAAGSHAYRPTFRMTSEDDYYERLRLDQEEAARLAQPPSVDDLFPHEIRDPLPEPTPAERGYRPAPCERCGKTFRTDAGARWHAANNRDCERWRKVA